MNVRSLIRRHPVFSYFGIAYLVPWLAFLVVVGPKLARGGAMSALDALTIFPVMEVGVFAAGIGLTALVDGRVGLRDLFSRIGCWRVAGRWYLAALVPPVFILAVLFSLSTLISAAFAPKIFPFGILFGVFAGLFEETGWMGYAFPKLRTTRGPLSAGLLLGVLWGFWHLPVVDFLGAAGPHGASWLPFFLAFVAVLIAIRLIIVRVYERTGSVLLAMLIHASSTGFLVVLSPTHVSPGQEALWYAVYAAVLWLVVLVAALRPLQQVNRRPQVAAAEGNL